MAKKVKAVLDEIRPEKGTKRFSKKAFDDLLTALANDDEFVAEIAVTKNKELAEVKEIIASKELRKFLKKVLEKAGMDKADAAVVLDPSFEIDNVDGLYEFMSIAIYEFIDAGQKFDFLPREDFKGSLKLTEKDETVKVAKMRNPQTNEDLGTWETKTKKHKVLAASSPAPEYLKARKRVD